MTRLFSLSLCLFISFSISSCSLLAPHKDEFSQGKIVTQEIMEDVFIGMTAFTAEEYLGKPVYKLEKENADGDLQMRWFYPFYEQNKDKNRKQELVLVFESGVLEEIEGDVTLTEENL
jgi:outer membrane protein assembly factor BamE (lipoprotein component of BamABCDE complex)